MSNLMNFILYPLTRFQPFKVLSIAKTIEAMEKEREFEKADELRSYWLSKVKFKNSAPLLFSQGNYNLEHRKNYQVALSSFESAVTAFQQQPLHYSAINPLDLYYGCAVSAIMLGKFEKGEVYLKEVKKYYSTINSGANPSEYTKFYAKRIKWIEDRLGEAWGQA